MGTGVTQRDADRVRRIFVFPRWEQNPYLTLLYLAAEAAGWEILGSVGVPGLTNAVAERLQSGDVVHVHWTAPITRDAATLEDAMERVQAFDDLLGRARAAGVHVLWTVHNELAHDTPFVEAELALNEVLGRRASRVIQLHDRTADFVAPGTRLPREKLVTIRHASYAGVYPELPSREEARELLGVPAGVPTVGLVGQLRPYKGVDLLLEAAGIAAKTLPELTVLLAGRTDPDQVAVIDALVPANVWVVRHHDFLPDEEIGAWIQASNVLALPYRRILNSGSALLAATLARPVILPDDTPLVDVYAGQPWVASYPAGEGAAEALAEQLVRLAPGDAAREKAARDFAWDYTPYDMSREFLRLLDQLEDER
ncbi:glycosyltransferase [Nocardioides jiangxiensis]|uniref:Uncharacterized protein n=1 Tax=Nocardioides jiangxiensis TaxID=3064524 RepID=A0ABT9B2V9_9ACTN|nr:glycosyltransferase [Nocardioides sp. WY-20]MDO7869179.1 hypothetical protein [Nocardioides sp. WY-20]